MSKQKKHSRRSGRAARKAQPPSLRRGALWAGVGFAVAGSGLAFYATRLTMSIARQGLVEASGCSINAWINCDVAHASSYAMLLGIPVAWWGFLFYLVAGTMLLYAVRTGNKDGAAGAVAVVWVLALLAVLFSIVKAFNLFSLGVLCLVCVGMYVANLGIAVSAHVALRIRLTASASFLITYFRGLVGQSTSLDFSPRPVRYGLWVVIIFGLGFVGIKNYQDSAIPQDQFEMDRALTAHFRQAPRTITIGQDTPVWGNPEGAITIVEFADFQCPACRDAAFHLRPTLYEFREDVQLHFVNFPLDSTVNEGLKNQVHIHAGPAARAAFCAGKMGDFWAFHDGLFKNQTSLGPALYRSLADEQNFDAAEFEACANGQESLDIVKRDIESGIAVQITGTPSLFVNGRLVKYWRNSDFVRAVVREELKRIGS